MRRKAKFYIYDMFSKTSLVKLREAYGKLGIKIRVGELDSIADNDAKLNNAQYGMIAFPVAIKGEYFVDYENDFYARNEQQQQIESVFYSSDQMIVLPFGNIKAKEIKRFVVDNTSADGYHCIVDFNESEIGNCIHFYVTRLDTGELLYEENQPL